MTKEFQEFLAKPVSEFDADVDARSDYQRERKQKEMVITLAKNGVPLRIIRQISFLPEKQILGLYLQHAKR